MLLNARKRKILIFLLPCVGRILPYWLGAYKVDGVFKWIKSGENIKLFLWHAGEPNDKSGHEKCIHTWDDAFDWNDNDCERELPFICEELEGGEN